MRDKRRVDELSIEELEQVLAMRKREARQKRLDRMRRSGRVIDNPNPSSTPRPAQPDPIAARQSLDDVVATIAQNPAGAGRTPRLVDGEATEDLPLPKHTKTRKQKMTSATKRLSNSLLLLVEVAAVFGLVYLGWELFQGIVILEEESAEAQAAADEARARTVPTIEPTPMLALNEVVLPGGHIWQEGQTPQLNIEEIPVNVRFAVADQIMRPVINRPPPTDETALVVDIPTLNIEQTIVQGADWEALKQGVGQVLNGYDPADPVGNVALTAHNDIYGELFRDLDQLQPGDQFTIQTEEQVYTYEVTGTEVVDPTAVHVLRSQGRATATLISCYPYRVNTQRIVVFADQIS
ncbi:MAG: class D sortase [Chloroflexota bacterium]